MPEKTLYDKEIHRNGPIKPEELDHIAGLLLPRRYRFAKSMPKWPHWYTLREWWPGEGEKFTEVVDLINTWGYKERWGRATNIALNLNGFKYWTMGAPADETTVINRRPVYDVTTPFDAGAAQLMERERPEHYSGLIHAVLGDLRNRDVLDIGCGIGWLPYTFNLPNYTGIDPAQPQVDEARKHLLGDACAVLQCGIEEYSIAGTLERPLAGGGKHSLALCLFDTAAYLEERWVRAIPRLATDYAVMFPDFGGTLLADFPSAPFAFHDPGIIPGRQLALGEYILVTSLP